MAMDGKVASILTLELPEILTEPIMSFLSVNVKGLVSRSALTDAVVLSNLVSSFSEILINNSVNY